MVRHIFIIYLQRAEDSRLYEVGELGQGGQMGRTWSHRKM